MTVWKIIQTSSQNGGLHHPFQALASLILSLDSTVSPGWPPDRSPSQTLGFQPTHAAYVLFLPVTPRGCPYFPHKRAHRTVGRSIHSAVFRNARQPRLGFSYYIEYRYLPLTEALSDRRSVASLLPTNLSSDFGYMPPAESLKLSTSLRLRRPLI